MELSIGKSQLKKNTFDTIESTCITKIQSILFGFNSNIKTKNIINDKYFQYWMFESIEKVC